MKQKMLVILFSSLILSGCTLGAKKESIMVTPTPSDEVPKEQLVGNDEDEHGCKASAGYSWCEIKQKCLRTWEEKCEKEIIEEVEVKVEKKVEESVKEAVTRILTKKYNWDKNKVSVQVNKEVGDFATGSVGFGEEVGGGGWLVKRIEGKWTLVWDGNGAVDCPKLKNDYKFPDEILKPGFCD